MSRTRSEQTQAEKLLQEYTQLASAYDQRWSDYLHASLHMTLEKVADMPACRVLDIACGTGRFLEKLAGRSDLPQLVGIDRVPAMLRVARDRIGPRAMLLECDATQLPFGDANFQLVTCTSALHYFPDADATLREIRRVMSPHGSLVITDWCRNYIWMMLLNRILPWTHHAHVHTFSVSELEQSLLQAGFSISSRSRRKIDWFWGLMTVHATPDCTEIA